MPGIESFLDGWVPDGGETALDVGANRGVWSLFLADRFERVYAIEPTPVLQVGLRFLHPRIHVLPVGAWSAKERRTFVQFAHEANTSAAEGWTGIMAGPPVGSFEAECLPIDLMDIEGHVDFMKIDAEAAETEVLRGARITIEHDRPMVIIEVHRGDYMPRKLMEGWGYRVEMVRHPYYTAESEWWDKHFWLIGEPE